MGGKKEIYRDVRFFYGALQLHLKQPNIRTQRDNVYILTTI